MNIIPQKIPVFQETPSKKSEQAILIQKALEILRLKSPRGLCSNGFFDTLMLTDEPERSEHYKLACETAKITGLYREMTTALTAYGSERGFDFFNLVWEKPAALMDKTELPGFPLEALPKKLAEFVCCTARFTQVSPDMVAVGALGIIAAAVQKKFAVNYANNHTEQLSLYFLISAVPAERKSSIMTALKRPFTEVQKAKQEEFELEEITKESEKATFEIKIAMLKRRAGKGDSGAKKELEEAIARHKELDKIRPPRLFSAGDCTIESLAELVADNGENLAVLTDEGGILAHLAGMYKSAPSFELVKQAYDGSTVTIDRKSGRNLFLKSPAISIVTYCQPSVLQSFTENPAFLGEGLCGRFAYALPPEFAGSGKRCFKIKAGSEENERFRASVEWYSEKISTLLRMDIPPQIITLTLSPEAEAYAEKMFDVYEHLIGGELKNMSDWAGKAFGRVMRISAILHIIQTETETEIENSTVIAEKTVCNAFKIGDYLIRHAKYAYGMIGNNPTLISAKKALDFMQRTVKKTGGHQLTRRDLNRFFNGSVQQKQLDEILELLESHGYIKTTVTPQNSEGGRPSTIIRINPFL